LKVGGGLNFVVGPMGSGKSLYGVRKIVAATIRGQYAVTNVELYDDAPERIAWHVCKTSRRKRALVADKVRRFYVYETDLQEAMRYRLPVERGEARAVFVWDEGHNDLNNRSWRNQGRDEILQWATQLRKLGFVGYLLSQHADNTDAALRRVCNFAIRLQNQREQTRMLGIRVTPWPLFLAAWYAAHVPVAMQAAGSPMKVERYFLGYERRLYDTWGLYHGLSVVGGDGLDVIHLPKDGRRAPKGLPPGSDVLELDDAEVVEVA
jgi:hypothetical protein